MRIIDKDQQINEKKKSEVQLDTYDDKIQKQNILTLFI